MSQKRMDLREESNESEKESTKHESEGRREMKKRMNEFNNWFLISNKQTNKTNKNLKNH